MFGLRRRNRKSQPAPSTTPTEEAHDRVQLSEEKLFDLIHGKLEDFIGVDGAWALVRRDPEAAADDAIFSSMSTVMLARDITSELLGTKARNHSVTPPIPAATEAAEVDEVEIPAPAASEASPSPAPANGLRDMIRPVPRDESQEQVDIELKTIATWADPQRHDPEQVDERIVAPVRAADASKRS